MRDRPPHDEDRDDDEGRRLGQRRQMLGLPVTVCVAGIRRASGDTNREERQQRRDQVDSGVRRLREQPETVRGDPCGDLERDQRAAGEHGDESGAALWGHALSIPKKKSPPWWALLAGGCAATYASVSPRTEMRKKSRFSLASETRVDCPPGRRSRTAGREPTDSPS